MIRKLKPKSEFSRNVLTLMTGTTIAQAIPIAISPILTRIYTPEDFGVYALFIAIVSIFGAIANAQYEVVIMLPKKDEDAINIFALGFIINASISISLLVIVVIFNDYFTKLLNNYEISKWLYFIPIAIFFTGLFNSLSYFNNRKKQYRDLAKATIMKSIALVIVQLLVGFIKEGASGLISGQIVSQFIANTKLVKNIIRDKVLVSKIKKIKIIALAKRYKDFPKFSIWAVLTNVMSQQFTNILISVFYSVSTLGLYTLVQRVLAMPSALIGNAIGQVFFQEAVKEKQLTGKTIRTFDSTVKKLMIIAVPSFGILFFIVEELFAFVFGEKWRLAGEYAEILLPLFFIRFLSSTVSMINTVFEKNKNGLYINILLLLTAVCIIWLAHINDLREESFFMYFSIVMSIEYILFMVYYYYLSRGKV